MFTTFGNIILLNANIRMYSEPLTLFFIPFILPQTKNSDGETYTLMDL
jgi:hypothetical protein